MDVFGKGPSTSGRRKDVLVDRNRVRGAEKIVAGQPYSSPAGTVIYPPVKTIESVKFQNFGGRTSTFREFSKRRSVKWHPAQPANQTRGLL